MYIKERSILSPKNPAICPVRAGPWISRDEKNSYIVKILSKTNKRRIQYGIFTRIHRGSL